MVQSHAQCGQQSHLDTEDIRLEAHLFGFDRNLYGETITVKLMEKFVMKSVFPRQNS